jgi:murein DD-endopeptidase MepM/ murein hydrolase activator NlpD
MLADGAVRALFGSGRVTGNRLVLDLGDGVYAMLAHLQQHSVTVAVGDRVTASQPIARCGNTGNSSEPHLHFQLCDRPTLATAAGYPFAFRAISIDGAAPADAVPRTAKSAEPAAIPHAPEASSPPVRDV